MVRGVDLIEFLLCVGGEGREDGDVVLKERKKERKNGSLRDGCEKEGDGV